MIATKVVAWWMAAGALVALDVGCATLGSCRADGASHPAEAEELVPGKSVEHRIDGHCDRSDWFRATAPPHASVDIALQIAKPFERVGVAGALRVYDARGALLAVRRFQPEAAAYDVTVHPAHPPVFVEVHAVEGRADYAVTAAVEVRDACGGCGPCARCEQGRCVAVPCCGKCPARACDRARDRCLVGTLPCGGRCPQGTVCDPDRDVCLRRCSTRAECRAGERCEAGVCLGGTLHAARRRKRRGRTARPGRTVRQGRTARSGVRRCRTDRDCAAGMACIAGTCRAAGAPLDLVRAAVVSAWSDAGGVVVRVALPAGQRVGVGATAVLAADPRARGRVEAVAGGFAQVRFADYDDVEAFGRGQLIEMAARSSPP